MKLSETCIRQPVLAIVLSLILVILGVVGWQSLEIRFFPQLTLPVVYVHTYYQGASAKLMESQVSTRIENAVAGINDVASISSSSYQQNSYVTVVFRLKGNFEQEASSVRDRVFGIRDKIPADADMPVITVGAKGNPVLGIGFTDAAKTPSDIRNYIERVIQPQLRQLPGVGEVDVMGASDYAMRIWLNAEKMAALKVTVTDVKTALTANNIYFPAGSFQGLKRNYGIVAHTQLQTADQFGNIIILHTSDGTVRLNDIAKIALGNTSLYDAPLRVDGQNGVELSIKPLQDANPITVAAGVINELHKLEANLPVGMHAKINFNAATFLKGSINETFIAMIEAIVLVILIVFLFLGSLRAASIPIVVIPVSFVAVLGVIKLLGFTINTMSLLGMVLAIGLVVDDAIVMLENIHRHIEKGVAPFEAALKGSNEIGRAVVVMGITLMAVYAPIGLVTGFTSELFKEFAFTLAAAVAISAFIALTLSPMMCSKVLLPKQNDTRYVKFLDRFFENFSAFYKRALEFCLNKRGVVVMCLAVFAVLGYGMFKMLPVALIPQEDIGEVDVSIAAPTGSSLDYTESYVKRVEDVVKKSPAVVGMVTKVSTSSASIQAILKPWGKRHLTTAQLVTQFNAAFDNIPGVNVSAYMPDIVNYGLQGSDIELNFLTSGTYQDMLPSVNKMVKLLKSYPGVNNVSTNLKFDKQQYAITINRNLAAVLGVNIQDIADTVQAMMSGAHWTDVQAGSKSYEVLVQMRKKDLRNFNAFNKLYVRAAPQPGQVLGAMVPVSSLVTLKPFVGQGVLAHYNRFRSGTIYANVMPGYSEGQAINFIKANLNHVISPNVQYAFSGKAEQFLQSTGSMTSIFILSLVFIYLVLSAQFGSFVDPFVVLLAVPLCIVGALFFLLITKGQISIYSEVGFVTLIGMISKHGILITQFTNTLREQGMAMREAIVKAAQIRLRPIIMTTAAMVFGTLPLAIATGPGSVGRHQIGWVIVGGLLFGTFFSLIVVPIAYSYLKHERH